jgi:hypothetical protein
VSRPWAVRSGVWFLAGVRACCLLQRHVQSGSGAHPLSAGGYFPGGKVAVPPPSSAAVDGEWSCTPSVCICLQGTQIDNFICTFYCEDNLLKLLLCSVAVTLTFTLQSLLPAHSPSEPLTKFTVIFTTLLPTPWPSCLVQATFFHLLSVWNCMCYIRQTLIIRMLETLINTLLHKRVTWLSLVWISWKFEVTLDHCEPKLNSMDRFLLRLPYKIY